MRSLFELPVLKSARLECGECTACCSAFPLTPDPDLWPDGKRAGVPCRFLGENCTIYDRRPAVCRDFRCSWLDGRLGNHAPDWRPDRSGLLIHSTTLDAIFQGRLAGWQSAGHFPSSWGGKDLCLSLLEMWPEALLRHPARSVRYRLGKMGLHKHRFVSIMPPGVDIMFGAGGVDFQGDLAVWRADEDTTYAEKVFRWWQAG